MSKLSELLAKAKLKAAGEAGPSHLHSNSQPQTNKTIIASAIESNEGESHHGIGKNGEAITYNQEQWRFIETVLSGKSCILIGAAGTGKTTSTRGAISELLRSRYFPKIEDDHKHLPADGVGIVAISYTRRAVMNLKKALPPELSDNCITIHKLLEYQPFFYEVVDPISGETKTTMRFEPNRHRYNPLPIGIKTIIIDESSMVSVDLFHKIYLAIDPSIRSSVQFIFLGDIQQLPPVFGSAILGYKMLQLPVIELTQVYRQALESPIIRLAHRILSGNPIPPSEYPSWEFKNQLKLHPWKKKINSEAALLTVAAFFKSAYDNGHYNPATDMILIPYNKACGTDELNKHIANHLARKHNKMTYEVIAGFNKYYFTEGEKVLYEKEDATLIGIKRNPTYAGTWPQPASTSLNYWGHLQESEEEATLETNPLESPEDIDSLLEGLKADVEDRVREASHILTIRLNDSDREVEIKSAAEINSLLLAYSITVHKSQGSEWKKVYLILHHSHSTMLQRELLYTAVTRAREELYCICEPESFTKGITGQRIKGNTIEEKSQFFKGKLESGEESLIKEMMQ